MKKITTSTFPAHKYFTLEKKNEIYEFYHKKPNMQQPLH